MSTPTRLSALAALVAPIALACGGQERPAAPATTTVAAATVESASVPQPVVDPAAPPANVSYVDAESAYQGHNYAEAERLFTGYTASHPDNPWGHYMLGLSAWKAGDHERALEGFDEALRLDPGHRKSLLNSGRVLLDTSRPREALERIERALTLEPLSSEALRLVGRARYELGQIPEAIDAYQRAIALDERDVWSMNNLGLIYIHQGRGAEAIPPLARAVELRGNAPVFQNNLGTALEQAGYTSAARQAYAGAVEADSTYAKASASLARLGGPVDPVTDSAQTVDLAVLSREFQERIEQWRDTTGGQAVGALDSVPAVDSASDGGMVRDTAENR